MAKTYKVLSIDEMTKMAEAGGITRFYRHTIKTTKSVVLTVDISEEDFTPEKAAPILDKKAQAADAIMNL